uniref:DPH-type MB domain-containing protein n=1 Tax=Oncorhynchus tshawytscha TaxID=74940 RepID=A0A8C8F618_ONCTS
MRISLYPFLPPNETTIKHKQGPDVSVTKAEEHLHRFIEVNQAWKVLSNKETNSGELNQSWPVDARVSLDDMTYGDDNEVYAYGCCCGGEFSIGREAGDENAIVRCDTCSLSIRSQEDKLTDWSRCCSLNPEELFDVKEVSNFSLRLHPLNTCPHFNRAFIWTTSRGFSGGQ